MNCLKGRSQRSSGAPMPEYTKCGCSCGHDYRAICIHGRVSKCTNNADMALQQIGKDRLNRKQEISTPIPSARKRKQQQDLPHTQKQISYCSPRKAPPERKAPAAAEKCSRPVHRPPSQRPQPSDSLTPPPPIHASLRLLYLEYSAD